MRVSDKGLWSCAAIDTQFNSNATVYSLSLYLSVLKEDLAVGICKKGFIMSKYSLQPDNLAGNGCYFASTNGTAYSSWDNNTNS
jgi:DNA topoisomerase VI subunit A